jgi:superfamily II DNA/RNA helicase
LSACEFLVSIEADCTLDMGFELDVRYIIEQSPTQEGSSNFLEGRERSSEA